MLDRAGNADRDIDFGSDDLAGLTDLVIVGRVARVDRGAAGADPGAELVGERVEQAVELLVGAEPAAAGNDDLGAGQLGAFQLGDLGAGEARDAGVPGTRNVLDAGRTAAGRAGEEAR